MKIYAISGLGADERVFKNLKLIYPIHTLKWVEPKSNESLKNYAYRLSDQINSNEEFILIGVSFGGMLAVALQSIVQPKLTLLISSAKNKYDLPFLYRWLGRTKLIQYLPHQWMHLPRGFAAWLFDAEHKSILFEIIEDTDVKFLKWALNAITHWDEEKSYPRILRIHGTKDKLIPYNKSTEVIPIKNGGHFMIVDRAVELSNIINEKIYNS